MLKFNVDFSTLLIGAEGARLLRDRRGTGDPAGALSAEEDPGPARGKRATGAEKTVKFNTAFFLKVISTTSIFACIIFN